MGKHSFGKEFWSLCLVGKDLLSRVDAVAVSMKRDGGSTVTSVLSSEPLWKSGCLYKAYALFSVPG